MDEQTWIHKAQNGDEAAFEQLVTAYEKQVYTMALRMVGNPEDALDVSQEAFLKAWRGLKGYRSDAKFSTWLYRLATNVAIDFLRREKRQKAVSLTDEEQAETAVEDAKADPFHQISEKMEREHIAKALEQLEPEYRQALVLRAVNGLSYDEIAQATGAKAGTVKSRIARAREKMRQMLERTGNKTKSSSSKQTERG
ncbi:MAG: sigma-70 family RNA polymerase sigma factor [Eubacteriales bacterium]